MDAWKRTLKKCSKKRDMLILKHIFYVLWYKNNFWNDSDLFDRLIINFVAITNQYFSFDVLLIFIWFLLFISTLFQKRLWVFIIFIFYRTYRIEYYWWQANTMRVFFGWLFSGKICFGFIVTGLSGAAARDVLWKKAFLEIWQNSQDNTWASFLLKLQATEHV